MTAKHENRTPRYEDGQEVEIMIRAKVVGDHNTDEILVDADGVEIIVEEDEITYVR